MIATPPLITLKVRQNHLTIPRLDSFQACVSVRTLTCSTTRTVDGILLALSLASDLAETTSSRWVVAASYGGTGNSSATPHPLLAESVPQFTSTTKASAGHASAQDPAPRRAPRVETGEYPDASRRSCRQRRAPERLEM